MSERTPSEPAVPVSVGVALGRFQPLHVDHLRYLLAARVRCDILVVGITDPDPSTSFATGLAEHRSRPENNPFTFHERLTMVRAALLAEGVTTDNFYVVPAPWPKERFATYLPPAGVATCFVTILDEWGEQRRYMLEDAGYDVEVLWRSHGPVVRGTEIRRRLRAGEPVDDLVPPAVRDLLGGLDRWRAPGGSADPAVRLAQRPVDGHTPR